MTTMTTTHPEIARVGTQIAEILQAWLKRKGSKIRSLAHIARVDEDKARSWLNVEDLPDSNQFTRLRRAIPKLNHIQMPSWDLVNDHRRLMMEQQAASRAGSNEVTASAIVVERKSVPVAEPVVDPRARPIAVVPVVEAPKVLEMATKPKKKIPFGEALRDACRANKLSAAELASTLGVNVSTVHRWIAGSAITAELHAKVVDLLPELKDVSAPIYDSATRTVLKPSKAPKAKPEPKVTPVITVPEPPVKTETRHQQLMAQFLDEETEWDPIVVTPLGAIHDRYSAWFKLHNFADTEAPAPLHSNIFGREIHRLRPGVVSERNSAGNGRTCLVGLKLVDSRTATGKVPFTEVPSAPIPSADTKPADTKPVGTKPKTNGAAQSPMQAAIEATPWALPGLRDVAHSTWAEKFVVTNHAAQRFVERYLETDRAPVPSDRIQLGHLIKTCWNKGWFEKIVHNDEEFFVLALPGRTVGQVFYTLLREDQADALGRFVAITVLTTEIKNQRNSGQSVWDVKLNTPFRALLQEAEVAQRLIPKKPDEDHIEEGKLPASAKPARSASPPPPAPAITLMPADPRWIQNARDASPWSFPPLGSGYTWERYIHGVAMTDLHKLYDRSANASALDYTIDFAIRNSWFASFECKGESWRLVALPPVTNTAPVVFALVRKNPLKQPEGPQRTRHHEEIVVAALIKPAPNDLVTLVQHVLSWMPMGQIPMAQALPPLTAPPRVVAVAPSSVQTLAPAPQTPSRATSFVSVAPVAPVAAVQQPFREMSLEDIALEFASAVSRHKDLAKQVKSSEDVLTAQNTKVNTCLSAVTDAQTALRQAQAALADAETGQARMQATVKDMQKKATQAKADADRLLTRIQGG